MGCFVWSVSQKVTWTPSVPERNILKIYLYAHPGDFAHRESL